MNQDGFFLDVERSVTDRAWRDRLADRRAAQTITQMHDLPDILGRVLAARHVAADDVEGFLAPTLRDLMPAAAAMCDLETGAARIVAAMRPITDRTIAAPAAVSFSWVRTCSDKPSVE